MSPHAVKQRGGKVVIIGASGFAEIACDYFNRDSNYDVVGFAVNADFLNNNEYYGLPLVAIEELAAKYPPSEFEVFVALTYSHLNRDRTRLVTELQSFNYRCASYISSAAFVSHNAEIGDNVFIFEDNTVQHLCQLKDNVILWSGNHIGHHTVISNNCFISSHVVISGFCTVGESCFIGVNATIGNNVSIGSDCTIGAGAVIAHDIPDNAAVQPEHSPVRENISRRLWKIRT